MQNSFLMGAALVIISALFYALQPLFATGLYQLGWIPLSVLVLRFGCSMILMGGYLVLMRRQIRKHFDIRALLFGFCMAGSALGYYVAGQRIGFSLAVMLLFAFPVGVTLFFAFKARRMPSPLKLAALALSVCGTYWVVGGGPVTLDGLGVAAGLAAACCYGTAMVITDGRQVQDPWVDVFWVSVGAVGILGTALIVQGVDFPIGLHSLGLGAGLAFSATIMATGLLIAGIAKIGASDAATLALFEAFFAALFSVMFLGDPASIGLVGGGLLILLGAGLLTRSARA